MKAEHSKEPWEFRKERDNFLSKPKYLIWGAIKRSGFHIARIWADVALEDSHYDITAEANARRIVSCVNACAGIADPEATVPELVEALESMISMCNSLATDVFGQRLPNVQEPSVLTKARAVLAKVEKVKGE